MKENNFSDYKPTIQDYSAVNSSLLESIDYEYKSKKTDIKIETEEFSAVCPWSGLPDYGSLIVEYTPSDIILELKSFKYYLYTYRNVGIYQEHAVNMIFEDLLEFLNPQKLKVILKYNIRGGITTTAMREL